MDLVAVEQALAAGQFRFTEHAQEQMAKRQLAEADVRQAVASPEQVLPVREGRVVAHRCWKAICCEYLLTLTGIQWK